jgi:hypothetical protein
MIGVAAEVNASQARYVLRWIAIACAGVLLLIVNTDLRESAWAFPAGVLLIAGGAIAAASALWLSVRVPKDG